MNKTVTINIGGIVFNIEIDAFERLDVYLKEIKKHFTDSQGRDEIMSDIEYRIAEMFQEKVGNTKSVLILEDVEKVIRMMGNPEDFTDAESKTEQTSNNHSTFYNEQMKNRRRRVYRDTDDRVVGGVCSGIANYFAIDPLWLRLTLAASFFLFGSGFLLYLILWIAIPEAKTTAEKLEMRGEPINIDNISKSINDEFEKVNESSRKFSSRARGFGNTAADFITSTVYSVVRFFGKFFAFAFIIFGIIFLSVLLAALFSDFSTIHISNHDDVNSYSFKEVLMLLFNNNADITLATLGLFLLIGIPLIMLVYKGVRMVFKIKNRNQIVSAVASVLFIIGIAICIYVFMDVAYDFKIPAKNVQHVVLKTPANKILYIKSNNGDKYNFEDEEDDDYYVSNKNNNLFKISSNGISFSSPEFDVIATKSDSFELVLVRTARGVNKKSAYERASNISYSFSQNDSVLVLNNQFELNKSEKWRNQNLKIVLKVPQGKTIFLSPSLKHIIYDIDNVTNTHDSKMMNRKWIMKEEGLTCVDCNGIKNTRKNSSKTIIIDEDFDDEEDF